MAIRIANQSVSAVAHSYALALLDGQSPVVIWLDLAPQHPKVSGAIWASLVNGTREWLRLSDDQTGQTHAVRGLGRRYHRLTIDAPHLAGRARPKHLRLVAPCACQIEALTKPFVVLAWTWRDTDGQSHRLSAATSLAAMLERYTPLPILLSWGEYLLAEAHARGFATPVLSGGEAPEGWVIAPAPWEDILSDGIRSGQIRLT